MIVVTLTDCPPRLRGDLSKWLLEINTGVYVGQINQRVREELWKRICENLPRGRATMVYSANNEQKMEFRVHNTSWQPVDYEGLTLMRRPLTTEPMEQPQTPPSKAAASRMLQRRLANKARREREMGYVVIDIETTGLDSERDEILELGAVRILDHKIEDRFSALIRIHGRIPEKVAAMTGITEEMVQEEGEELAPALEQFWAFIGQRPIVGHNLQFDRDFLGRASAAMGIPVSTGACWDTLSAARRKVRDLENYRLETLAAYFEIETEERHRALADCITTFRVYEKLNEI